MGGEEETAGSGCSEGQDWGRVDVRGRKALPHPGKDGLARPWDWLKEKDTFQKEREAKIQAA